MMNQFAENKDREAALKKNIADVLRRKLVELPHVGSEAQNEPQTRERLAEPQAMAIQAAEVQRENQRLHRLLGELLLKNQQLRAELALREKQLGARMP